MVDTLAAFMVGLKVDEHPTDGSVAPSIENARLHGARSSARICQRHGMRLGQDAGRERNAERDRLPGAPDARAERARRGKDVDGGDSGHQVWAPGNAHFWRSTCAVALPAHDRRLVALARNAVIGG